VHRPDIYLPLSYYQFLIQQQSYPVSRLPLAVRLSAAGFRYIYIDVMSLIPLYIAQSQLIGFPLWQDLDAFLNQPGSPRCRGRHHLHENQALHDMWLDKMVCIPHFFQARNGRLRNGSMLVHPSEDLILSLPTDSIARSLHCQILRIQGRAAVIQDNPRYASIQQTPYPS